MRPIRILLVDDHRILRLGLKAILSQEDDLQVIGETGDGREAVRLARQLEPDVVVMDVQLPGLSGADATRAICQSCPRVGVLALTMHDNSHYVLAMMKAGARSYLLKESAGPDLANAIRATSRGQSVLDPAVAGTVVEILRDVRPPRSASDELTAREREIFELIALGYTSREIAAKLGLAAKTVDNCRSRILQKLGARNKAEAVAIGLQQGLFQAIPA